MSKEILQALSERINFLEKEIITIKNQLKELVFEDSPENSILPKTNVGKIVRPLDSQIKEQETKPPKNSLFDLELLLGGNILGKLGLVAILLAVAWFIKFAFDNEWINESGKIFIGINFGFLGIIWGLILAKKKIKIVPESLVGTGISIVYISIYSAYYFFDLLNAKETFAFFLIISLVTSFISGKIHSEVLYIFGLLGSILTPILLTSGENSYRFLFIYLTIINLVFYYISIENKWQISPYLLFLSNIVIYSGWTNKSLTISNLYIPFLYLTTTFFIFGLREIYILPKIRKFIPRSSLIFFGILVLVYLLLTPQVIELINEDLIGHFYLFAILILILFNWIFENKSVAFLNTIDDSKPIRYLFLFFIASSFLASLSIYLENRTLSFALILFAAVISIAGIQFKNKIYIYSSGFIWLIALLRLYFVHTLFNEQRFILLNSRFALFFLTAGILLFLYRKQKQDSFHPFNNLFIYTSFITIIFGSLVEVYYSVSDKYYRNLFYSYTLAFYSTVFLILGFKYHFASFRRAGILLATLLIAKFYFFDIWFMSIIIRIIAGFSLGLGLIILSIVYQKYKDKIKMDQILKIIIGFSFLYSISYSNGLYSDSFNPNSYKYVTKINTSKEITENNLYGKIKISEEISKFHGTNDIRLSYDKKLVPYFVSTSTETVGKSGETKPKVIFDNVTTNGRTYVIKLENPPKKSEYFELELSSNENYESFVTISLGENPDNWGESFTANLYKYSGVDSESSLSKVQFSPGNYRYARFSFETKNEFQFLAASYKSIVNNLEYKTNFPVSDLEKSFDSDKKATVYYLDNKESKPISRIELNFTEERYDRSIEILERKSSEKKFVQVASGYLKRVKDKKNSGSMEPHSFSLNSYQGGELKIIIENNDDAALNLSNIDLYSQMYEIIFSIPTNYDPNIPLLMYYGNQYVRFPSFEIRSLYDSNKQTPVSFALEKHSSNENYSHSISEPPVSSWIIRICFLVGFIGLMYPTYKILKKYKEEI